MIFIPTILAAIVLCFAVAAYRSEVVHSKNIHNYSKTKRKYNA